MRIVVGIKKMAAPRTVAPKPYPAVVELYKFGMSTKARRPEQEIAMRAWPYCAWVYEHCNILIGSLTRRSTTTQRTPRPTAPPNMLTVATDPQPQSVP